MYEEIMEPIMLFRHWHKIRSDLYTTIDQFADDELNYQPFDGSWNVGQIMLHIADTEDGWLRDVLTRELDQWPDYYTLDNYRDKPAIKQALAQIHNHMAAYLDTL
jgi:uncharacterized damage-inducible protein DinB